MGPPPPVAAPWRPTLRAAVGASENDTEGVEGEEDDVFATNHDSRECIHHPSVKPQLQEARRQAEGKTGRRRHPKTARRQVFHSLCRTPPSRETYSFIGKPHLLSHTRLPMLIA